MLESAGQVPIQVGMLIACNSQHGVQMCQQLQVHMNVHTLAID